MKTRILFSFLIATFVVLVYLGRGSACDNHNGADPVPDHPGCNRRGQSWRHHQCSERYLQRVPNHYQQAASREGRGFQLHGDQWGGGHAQRAWLGEDHRCRERNIQRLQAHPCRGGRSGGGALRIGIYAASPIAGKKYTITHNKILDRTIPTTTKTMVLLERRLRKPCV